MDDLGTMFTPAERAARVAPMIEEYARRFEGPAPEKKTTLVDLVADLRHWADQHGFDFDEIQADAAMHHEGETGALDA